MKTQRIDNSELAEHFFFDSRLLGIVAPLKDYLFCYHINAAMNFDFRVLSDVEISLKRKNRDYVFFVYHYADPYNSIDHYLYNNQWDGEYLLPELKHLDYLWLMKGDMEHNQEFDKILNSIRNINGVQLVSEITNQKIKHKENLLF